MEFKGKVKHEIYSYADFNLISEPTQSFLFKINGSCNDASSIIVTKEDFINYRNSHEGFLILLKRDLMCKNFLFLGTSFRDDVLRMCIKDIKNCISYTPEHYAIVTSTNPKDLEYIAKDLVNNYSINSITVSNPGYSYLLAQAISKMVKFKSIFISGAKSFVRGEQDETDAKSLCDILVKTFSEGNDAYKIISGMGMSIGGFVSGAVLRHHKGHNINRYLKMAPFPFDCKESNDNHRKQLIKYAGVFIFLYGDLNEDTLTQSSMWREYKLAKEYQTNIIIALPLSKCVSMKIYEEEMENPTSFMKINEAIFTEFFNKNYSSFFEQLKNRIKVFKEGHYKTYFGKLSKKLCNGTKIVDY